MKGLRLRHDRDWNPDLSDAAAVQHQLSNQINWGLAVLWVHLSYLWHKQNVIIAASICAL